MQKIVVETPIYKYSLNNFLKHKKELLDAIDKRGVSSWYYDHNHISNTDYHYKNEEGKEYQELTLNILKPFINDFRKEYSCEINLKNGDLWFQQYNKNDYHAKHIHTGCNYSSIFYVELPKTTETTFYINDKSFKVDVQEGDYIIFPSAFEHGSEPNKTDKRKTIISINLNIT